MKICVFCNSPVADDAVACLRCQEYKGIEEGWECPNCNALNGVNADDCCHECSAVNPIRIVELHEAAKAILAKHATMFDPSNPLAEEWYRLREAVSRVPEGSL